MEIVLIIVATLLLFIIMSAKTNTINKFVLLEIFVFAIY
jgi:hypothetical protein